MAIVLLTALAAVSAALAVISHYKRRKRTHYVFKPLTMLFVISIALLGGSDNSALYKYLIVAGLLFSLAGDVFLMFPERFVPSLISFLIAHIFYISAFISDGDLQISIFSSLPILLYGAVMAAMLYPHLGKMKMPVAVYMAAILLMLLLAFNRWKGAGEMGSMYAFAGAFFFTISDSFLAMDRFRKRFPSSQFFILTTYFTAQWLIALSV